MWIVVRSNVDGLPVHEVADTFANVKYSQF